MRKPATELLVQRLESFGPLPEVDKAALRATGIQTHEVAARTDLAQEGQPPKAVFLVVEGFACRYKVTATGARQVTAYVLPGDFCDIDVVLAGLMDHSIGTLSACRIAKIPFEAVRVMLERPVLARLLRMATLIEMANAREWLVNVGRRSAVQRAAHLICEMYYRLDAVGLAEGNTYHLPLTQADLAEATGMSCVQMNRSLAGLKNAGLIRFKNRRLTILDLPQLEVSGDFQPSYLNLGVGPTA